MNHLIDFELTFADWLHLPIWLSCFWVLNCPENGATAIFKDVLSVTGWRWIRTPAWNESSQIIMPASWEEWAHIYSYFYTAAVAWNIRVFLRINQPHNQVKIFPIGTGFHCFSLCNMVKHERNVRSLITTIYLPAKLFLLRPSDNIQDFLRDLSDCPQIFIYQVYNSLQWRTSHIKAEHQGRKRQQK